jgi:hypothetical protein
MDRGRFCIERRDIMLTTPMDVLHQFPVRKTKAQKQAFRDAVQSYAQSLGYPVAVEKGSLGGRNLVIGNPKTAKYLVTAHYDTCARLPFPNFITPKNPLLSILYGLLPVAVLLGITALASLLTGIFTDNDLTRQLVAFVVYFGLFVLMFAGPANKHTANDNTSGVTLLIDIMSDLPEELKDKVAFIFFDLEERGTVGSKCYKKMHPGVAKKKLVLNFDCVSDGKNILFVPKKGAYDAESKIAEAFAPTGEYTESYSVEVARKAFYPSDQRNFERGVGVSALNKSKGGILYMDKIHTPKDTVYDEENIEFLKTGAIKLVEII